MIEFEDVSRVYQVGDEPVYALHDVSETIEAGDYVAVMGPSGSGKSTFLNILGCLDRPTSGHYRLEGQQVGGLAESTLSEIRRHKIGFVFQSFHLVPRLTAEENVALPMLIDGLPREQQRTRAREALEAVGLDRRAGHRPAELSGGERQRVAIARATIMRPRILLADEPTGNLDSAAGRQVMELLQQMNQDGLTLIVVTHNTDIGRRANRIVMLRDGRIAKRLRGHELSRATSAETAGEATT